MSVIIPVCLDLGSSLNDKRTREQLLLDCASNRLSELYLTHSDRLDNTLNELINCVNGDDVDYMCRVLRRLNKCLAHNRNQLISLIERMY